MSDTVDLLKEIPALAREEWSARKRPILLSTLGGRLSEAAKVLVRAQNIALKRYVQEHLSNELRFLRMEAQGGGVAPRAETVGISDDELEAAYTTVHEQGPPRYQFAVWRSFRDPIPAGTRRFLVFTDTGRADMVEREDDVKPGDNSYEVLPDDVAVREFPDRVPSRDSILEAIEAWRQRTGIEASKLTQLRPPRTALEHKEGSTERRGLAPIRSIPDAIHGLRAFTREELARIQVPADVLLSFLERASRR